MISKFKRYLLLISLIYFSSQIYLINSQSRKKKAVCVLTPDNNSGVNGKVTFSQKSEDSSLRVDFDIRNIQGTHGFHIHEIPNITGGCDKAGGHYNPTNSIHGGPHDKNKHVGDFGNLNANNKRKVIKYTSHYYGSSLFGKNTLIGKTCVLHAGVDDLGKGKNVTESKKNGNSGKKIACGILYESN